MNPRQGNLATLLFASHTAMIIRANLDVRSGGTEAPEGATGRAASPSDVHRTDPDGDAT